MQITVAILAVLGVLGFIEYYTGTLRTREKKEHKERKEAMMRSKQKKQPRRRRVMVSLELETDLPITDLKKKEKWTCDPTTDILQIQANVIRTK